MERIDLDFGAITIDNSTLKGEGYKFNEGLLAQFRQFKNSPVQVIQTDIVHNEAIKHIGQEISNTRSSIDRALRSASKQLKIDAQTLTSARNLLTVEGTEKDIAQERMKSYYSYIDAIVLNSADYADLSILMDMYFATAAPFETGKDKKNEFPDAIALLCIEGWAKEHDINVIAVSQDKGWGDFCENSSRITVVPSLADALEKFQPHNKVEEIISNIREDFLFEDSNHVLESIENAIISKIEYADVNVIADSSMYYEYDDVVASYISHDFLYDKGHLSITVVRIEDESIVLKLGAMVKVEVEASFDFSVKDSIDKDFIMMGGNICKAEESFYTDILITLSGDFSKDFTDISVDEVEVLENITDVNFGEVEPDWLSHEDDRGIW